MQLAVYRSDCGFVSKPVLIGFTEWSVEATNCRELFWRPNSCIGWEGVGLSPLKRITEGENIEWLWWKKNWQKEEAKRRKEETSCQIGLEERVGD